MANVHNVHFPISHHHISFHRVYSLLGAATRIPPQHDVLSLHPPPQSLPPPCLSSPCLSILTFLTFLTTKVEGMSTFHPPPQSLPPPCLSSPCLSILTFLTFLTMSTFHQLPPCLLFHKLSSSLHITCQNHCSLIFLSSQDIHLLPYAFVTSFLYKIYPRNSSQHSHFCSLKYPFFVLAIGYNCNIILIDKLAHNKRLNDCN